MQNIITAMKNYNTKHNCNLTLLDALIINHVATNEYTTDADLAEKTLCSERTIKRAINKLCDLNLLEKYHDPDHTKHVHINLIKYQELLGDFDA